MFFFFNFITDLLPCSHHELLLLCCSVYKTKTYIFWRTTYFEGSPHVVTWLGPNLSRYFESTTCLASCTRDNAAPGWEGWMYALYTERAAFDLRVKRLLWFRERMQFSGILWHMNRQKICSSSQMMEMWMTPLPSSSLGKYRTVNQINQNVSQIMIFYSLFTHLYVVK